MTALEAALDFIGKGWAPLPIPYRQKRPVIKNWPALRITEANAPHYFNGDPMNVGVLLGEPSGNLDDIDLDCREAVLLAPAFLPPTDSVFGRASKPRSHWLYVSAIPKRIEYAEHPDDGGETLLELRSGVGHQTVFPGSVHECGEPIEWADCGEPAEVDPEHLTAAVGRLAAACLLVRCAPSDNRSLYMLDISGMLVRELGRDGAAAILGPVGRLVFGTRHTERGERRLLDNTVRKLEAGEEVPGWPKLVERIGRRRADKLSEWLGLASAAHGAKVAEEIAASASAKASPTPPPSQPAEQPWPAPLAPEAYHGIAGEIVRLIEPESESDPTALLFQLLGAAGNIMGPDAYVQVEGDRHPPRLFQVHVGRTSKGRKGTSWGRVRSLLETVAPLWIRARLASGLSSGEGVIYEVRDPVEERQKKKGKVATVVVDPGVTDKRLLVFEGEFAKALRSMERQGNTLSAVLRDCWDHGNLRTLIKNNPNRATGAHVGVIGHITDDELRRYLDRTEMANGLANRIIFVCVQRSKMLPRGGRPIDWSSIEQRLRDRLVNVPQGQVHLTDAAWRIWEGVYPTLSADRPGMLGAILGRAEAQVIRLALIYALLDGSAFIDEPHLLAGLSCWDYAEASARYVFGDSLGDPVADEILRALRERPNGMTRNELMNHFGRNFSSSQIGRALSLLAKDNFVVRDTVRTAGRPAERWRAVK